MKISEILRNPLVKWTGIILVLYFALFDNKEKPNSLGNRLSADRVKQGFKEAKEKSNFIAANVKKAQQLALEQKARQKSEIKSESQFSIEDLEEGTGEDVVSCGDRVEISYGLYTKNGKQLEFSESTLLVIGSKKNLIIEPNIIGMKLGGVRNINISHNLKPLSENDKQHSALLKLNDPGLRYQVSLLSLKKSLKSLASCY